MEEEQTAPVEQVAQAEEAAPAPEPSPLEGLLDEIDAMKARIAQLEQFMASHGHELDGNAVTHIAGVVVDRINKMLRRQSSPVQ